MKKWQIYSRFTDSKKYDIAITTSCAYLDFIVVDTVDIGEKCINFLREKAIGRANFLCLDRVSSQIRALREQPFEAPNQSLRLFDLITTKEPRF